MRNLVQYFTFTVLFMAGVMMGTMAATPGKSESYSILDTHGVFDSAGNSFFVYMPNEDNLSTEELEALAVISNFYSKVQIMYPEVH